MGGTRDNLRMSGQRQDMSALVLICLFSDLKFTPVERLINVVAVMFYDVGSKIICTA